MAASFPKLRVKLAKRSAGSLAASAAPYTASGAFTAVRCTNIFDPCL